MTNPEIRHHSSAREFTSTLFEQIKNIYPNLQSDHELLAVEARETKEKEQREFEQFLREAPILDILSFYNIDAENITIPEKEGGIIEIALKKHFWKERLPDGYGYKGGAARTLLRINIGLAAKKPRDIDIIRLSEEEPHPNTDNAIAEKFMPEDFAHGHGVEVLHGTHRYFNTRDFTINEVYATEESIYCTEQCILDTIREIVRITEYEYGIADEEGEEYDQNKTHFEAPHKLLIKLVRLYSEGILENNKTSIAGTEDAEFSSITNMFWVALQIEKAYEQGPAYAEAFVKELVSKNILPGSITSAQQAAIYVGTKLHRPFYFRCVPVSQLDIEKEMQKTNAYKTWEKYQDFDETELPKRRGHGKSRGDK